MNKTKFSLADVLTVLAAIAFGFVCFLGANFLNIDNDKVWGMSNTAGCTVIALFIAMLMFGTAFGAKLLKGTSNNFRTSFVGEVILLTLFLLFAVFFSTKTSPFPHFFTVEAQRSQIKSELQTSINQAENMFAEYERYAETREKLYKRTLQRVATNKTVNPPDYINYGFNQTNGVSDASQIDTKMFTVHADLFPTNYSDTISQKGIKEVAAKWMQEAKSQTEGWKRIGVVGVVNDIEKNSNQWRSNLITLSQIRENGEQASDFQYPLAFGNVKKHFTTLVNPLGLALSLAILIYFLMLLSWFVTKRSTKSDYGFLALIRSLFSRKQKKTDSNFDIEY